MVGNLPTSTSTSGQHLAAGLRKKEGKEDQRQKGRGGREARTGGGRRGGDALRSREEPRGGRRGRRGGARKPRPATGVGGPPQKKKRPPPPYGSPSGRSRPTPGCFQKPFSRFSFRLGKKVPSPPALSGAPCSSSSFVGAASPHRLPNFPHPLFARRQACSTALRRSSPPPPLPCPPLHPSRSFFTFS